MIGNCQTHLKNLLQMSKETDNREFAFGSQHTDFLLILTTGLPLRKRRKAVLN